MLRKHCLTLPLVLMAAIPIQSAAQQPDTDPIFGVFGSIGLGGYWGDESFRGNGASFGGSFDAFPLGLLGFEAGVDGGSHTRQVSSGVSWKGSTLHVYGDLVLRFTHTRLQPYLAGGIGYLRSSTNRSEPAGQEFEADDNSAAFNLALGLLWFMAPRWSVRPELRWVNSASDAVIQRYYRASIGVGYHFGGR